MSYFKGRKNIFKEVNKIKKKPAENNAYNGNYQQKLVTACMRGRYGQIKTKKHHTKNIAKNDRQQKN